jgi:hypothetical protein
LVIEKKKKNSQLTLAAGRKKREISREESGEKCIDTVIRPRKHNSPFLFVTRYRFFAVFQRKGKGKGKKEEGRRKKEEGRRKKENRERKWKWKERKWKKERKKIKTRIII